MMNEEDLRAAVGRVFSSPSSSTIDDLSKTCRYCATDDNCVAVIDAVEDLGASLIGLLEVALEGRADTDDPKTVDVRRGRLALRILVNAAQRSQKLRNCIPAAAILLWRALLRVTELQVETCASLVAVAKEMHTGSECALSPNYAMLLSDLALLWESVEDKSWISALFSIHLELDYAFLAHCFADFEMDAFTALLRVTETIMDASETTIKLVVHSNNIQFAVTLLERILFDFGEGQKENSKMLIEQILYAIDIIASAALRPSDYSAELLTTSTAVEVIVDVLKAVLDAEAVQEQSVRSTSQPTSPAHDRPGRPVAARFPCVQESRSLSALSESLLLCPPDIRGSLKCTAVRAIGNLCCDSSINRLSAGARGGVIAVLQCAKIGPHDKPFIMQWSIAALRHMCVECIDNQDIILSIDQKPTGILDRDKLFKELGVDVELDPTTGKLRIKRSGASIQSTL